MYLDMQPSSHSSMSSLWWSWMLTSSSVKSMSAMLFFTMPSTIGLTSPHLPSDETQPPFMHTDPCSQAFDCPHL